MAFLIRGEQGPALGIVLCFDAPKANRGIAQSNPIMTTFRLQKNKILVDLQNTFIRSNAEDVVVLKHDDYRNWTAVISVKLG